MSPGFLIFNAVGVAAMTYYSMHAKVKDPMIPSKRWLRSLAFAGIGLFILSIVSDALATGGTSGRHGRHWIHQDESPLAFWVIMAFYEMFAILLLGGAIGSLVRRAPDDATKDSVRR